MLGWVIELMFPLRPAVDQAKSKIRAEPFASPDFSTPN
jgi:hypothetical protein